MTEKRKGAAGAAAKGIEKLSFEDALAELEQIVSRLESGQVNLEDSIEIYERGSALKAHCEEKLKTAKEKIEKIVVREDGSIEAKSADFSA